MLVEDDFDDDTTWTIHHALAQVQRQARREPVIEDLQAKGVPVVEHDGYGTPAGLTALGAPPRHRGGKRGPRRRALSVVVVTRDGGAPSACDDAGRRDLREPWATSAEASGAGHTRLSSQARCRAR